METTKVSLNPAQLRYLLALVFTDRERMRHHVEHAKSHGERTMMLPEYGTATDVEIELINAIGKLAG